MQNFIFTGNLPKACISLLASLPAATEPIPVADNGACASRLHTRSSWSGLDFSVYLDVSRGLMDSDVDAEVVDDYEIVVPSPSTPVPHPLLLSTHMGLY